MKRNNGIMAFCVLFLAAFAGVRALYGKPLGLIINKDCSSAGQVGCASCIYGVYTDGACPGTLRRCWASKCTWAPATPTDFKTCYDGGSFSGCLVVEYQNWPTACTGCTDWDCGCVAPPRDECTPGNNCNGCPANGGLTLWPTWSNWAKCQ